VEKEECIGHVQKRMGTRLRNLLKKKQGCKLRDGKGLGGAGRLTNARIDFFQSLYGNAIRDNKGNADEMSRQTKAILKHYSDPGDHSLCIPEKCSYLRDPTNYKPVDKLLPQAVVEEMQPIFDELAHPKILSGCINLRTQNQNESFHHVIWGFVPKEQPQSMNIITLGLNLAVVVFNRGYTYTARKLFAAMGWSLPRSSAAIFESIDKFRISLSQHQSGTSYKEKRSKRRNQRRKRMDAFRRTEKITYKPGVGHAIKTPKKSSRAPPLCRTCKKPRKGHPKGPCTLDNQRSEPTYSN
jgi:hypothetical protein